MTQAVSPVFQAATEYATSYGWNVFPVKQDKSPATRNGFKDATSDPEGFRRLWAKCLGAGVGIRTGGESGIIVLDIDPDKGGRDSLAALIEVHGPLPETIETCTGGGGTHLYFRHRGIPARNSTGKLGPGLDVRGDGGYVVAPPSPHPSGTPYGWREGRGPAEIEVAEMPDWLADLVESGEAPSTSPAAGSERDAIPEGQRNSTLTSFAGQLRQVGVGLEEIEATLRVRNAARCEPPLDKDEVAGIAASVARYEPGAGNDQAAERALKVRSAKEVVATPDPPGDADLLGPLVVRGSRTVIGAHTGEGKTTVSFQMIEAVTTRRNFLDWRGSGGRALIIDAEQGLRTIKRRLREAGLEESVQVDYLRVPDGLALDQDGGSDVVQLEAILEAGQYDLVLFDPLYKFHRGDSNEERHAVDLMRRLDAWRERYGFGLILLVHRRKSQVGNHGFTMDDLYGSGAYLRGAEVVLGLRSPRPGYANLHIFKDRDGDLPVGEKWGLLFDREEGFRRDPEADKEKETAIDKVRAALEETPDGLTLARLKETCGYSEKTCREATQALGAESTSGPSGRKSWRLLSEEEAHE
jgi:hypothetical protein